MNFKQSFILALKSLKSSKMRSFLTMLGIIIGIGSVIILASALLPANISVWVMIGVTFLMAIVPMVYSYCFYRKKKGKIDE